jgi:hypothetical protein
MEGYCENAACRVILFRIHEHDEGVEARNCPGCGRMGRLKDEK